MASSAPDHLRTPGLISNRPCYEGINLGLNNSSLALRFALGHDVDSIPSGAGTENEDAHEFYALWRDQPAAECLQRELSIYEDTVITITSRLLGCQITVEADNSASCVELSESMLAALESLLATGVVDNLIAHEPALTIRVKAASSVEEPFTYEISDLDGTPYISVTCGDFDPHHVSPDQQRKLKDQLYNLLVGVLARVILLQDPEQVIAKLFGDELALDRSMSFTSGIVTLGNVLGDSPKTRLAAWDDPESRDYPLARADVWDATERKDRSESGDAPGGAGFKPGDGEPPPELLKFTQVRQSELQTISLIHLLLWDQAGWSGTAFARSPDSSGPPFLAFLFEDSNVGAQIFAGWRKDLGEDDPDEQLRVTIIRGINKNNPYKYRILIGPDITSRSDIKYAFLTYRMNTMTPSSNENITAFLEAYESFGGYILTHAFRATASSEPVFVWEDQIAKSELHVREAWEIGRNDLDAAGILPSDDPIIPKGQEKAPIIDLLRWKRENESDRPQETTPDQSRPPVRPRKKQGRNELCACGSGRKYKRCCGG